MKKIFLVAWHEYRRHVFKKRFLMGLLSVPLMVLVMVGLVFLIMSIQFDTTPIGYVDYSGLLTDPLPAPAPEKPEKPVPFLRFENEKDAQASLDAGSLQGYYIVPEDYLTTGELTLVYLSDIKASPRYQFYDFLSVNLLRDKDPQLANRLLEGGEITVVTPDGSRISSKDDWFSILVPMLSGILFMVIMMTTGGYLMAAVVEEKENRTMEVIITSVSPNQFMAGKIIGDISIGMTQILFWISFIILTILIGRNSLEFLRGIHLSNQTLLLFVVILFPSFVMVAALMAMVGSTVVEAREGQQVTGLLSLPIWLPYILMMFLLETPNSPLAVTLSMLPMTAPLTMSIRAGLTVLPAWQIFLSSLIQVIGAVAAIWLAGRVFRLGMLQYGRRLRLRELFIKQAGGSL